MLGEGVPSARRSDAFGISYALANVGVGLGALIGGFVVDAASPHSFVYLFVGDAISNLLFAAVLFAMSDAPAEAVAPTACPAREQTRVPLRGYRNVLGDRRLLAVLLVNTLLVTFATSQITSGFPVWSPVRRVIHQPPSYARRTGKPSRAERSEQSRASKHPENARRCRHHPDRSHGRWSMP